MRFVAKWISQLLLVLGALLAGEWSLFDFLGLVRNGEVYIGRFHAAKANFQLTSRLLFSAIAIGLIVAVDVLDVYLPQRELRRFRTDYLDGQCEIWRKDLFKGSPIRVGVLYARRRWYWPFWKSFVWRWSNGFDPPGHLDVNMRLACWQGISGQAYQTEISKSAFFPDQQEELSFRKRWLYRNEFRFSRLQLKKTRIVRGIISIPLLRKIHGDSPSYRAVGVLTLDAYNAGAAEILKQNETALVEYFFRVGKLLGSLDI